MSDSEQEFDWGQTFDISRFEDFLERIGMAKKKSDKKRPDVSVIVMKQWLSQLPDATRAALEATKTGEDPLRMMIHLDQVGDSILRELVKRMDLDDDVEAGCYGLLFHTRPDNWQETKVSGLAEAFRLIQSCIVKRGSGSNEKPNLEAKIGERWYPVHIQIQKANFMGMTFYFLQGTINVWNNVAFRVGGALDEDLFKDEFGAKRERTIKEVLASVGLRAPEINMDVYNAKVRLAQRTCDKIGKQMLATSKAITKIERGWWNVTEFVDFGTPEMPRKIIIEPEMEGENRHNGGCNCDHCTAKRVCPFPFVRIFSLDTKQYFFVDVEDLKEYTYDKTAIDRLVMPPNMDTIVRKVFTTPVSNLFGDVMAHKHGGMVILAHGGPGVGKTLTAEVFAEYTERPLYVLEVGELGISPDAVEDNLQRVFKRASRWNAVLLFDEADIFMAQRDDNLERNAIVGIFLRLLDYYPGLMFLTTNRCDILDEAFRSRITLTLHYPKLGETAKIRIWDNFLKMSGITVVNDVDPEMGSIELKTVSHTGIPEMDLNGRQIRNLIRLIRVLYNDKVTVSQVCELFSFTVGEEKGAFPKTLGQKAIK